MSLQSSHQREHVLSKQDQDLDGFHIESGFKVPNTTKLGQSLRLPADARNRFLNWSQLMSIYFNFFSTDFELVPIDFSLRSIGFNLFSI